MSEICIPLPTTQFLRVIDFIRKEGSDRDPAGFISEAVDQFLIMCRDDPETFLHQRFDPDKDEERGYTWKYNGDVLYLPHGTQIRMPYNKKYFYAEVVDDQIIYGGKAVSPGILANTIAGSSRNAWRDLWIKKPKDQAWTLANAYRG